MDLISRAEGGFWVALSPLWSRETEFALSIAWFTFGWDKECPLRPWPQFGVEARGDQGGSGILSWVSWLGLTLCVQSADRKLGPRVAKELTQAIYLYGLPENRDWTDTVLDTLRLVAPPELASLTSEDPYVAYCLSARMCGVDPDSHDELKAVLDSIPRPPTRDQE